ncbi:unnamed protein product [Orchesella dallaii]|uniref:Transmembrane protein n=1 Tax=Orchesella dallaii TaxID=48710 RepID=A0ABP1PZL1_9HEXA
MAISPCPCMPLKLGVRIFAVIDVVLGILNVGLFLLILFGVLKIDTDGSVDMGTEFLFIAGGIIIPMIQLLFAFRLYYGAKTNDISKCRSWLTSTVIIVILYIIALVSDRGSLDSSGAAFTVISVLTVYKVYEIAAVVSFIEELKWNLVANQTNDRQGEGNHVAPYIVSNDLPPSYVETQNEPYVEPPPPHYVDSMSPEKRDTAVQLE